MRSWDLLGQVIDGSYNLLPTDPPSWATPSQSGYSVSSNSDGTIVAVGSPFARIYTGVVIVYKWDINTSTWQQLGGVIYGSAGGANLGQSVSLNSDGTIVAIGAPEAGDNYNGSVLVYKFNSTTSTWDQLGQRIDGGYYSRSGRSVSLNSAGTIVAIGGPTLKTTLKHKVTQEYFNGIVQLRCGYD